MKSKKILFIISFLFLTFYSFSQVSVDCEQEFYTDAVSWYLKGFLDFHLPEIKPYPINVTKKILEEVVSCDDETESLKAQNYMKKYFGKVWNVSLLSKDDIKLKQIERGGNGKNPKYENMQLFALGIGLSGDIPFTDKFGFSYDTTFFTNNSDVLPNEVLPRYILNSAKNKVKPFLISNDDNDLQVDLNANFTYGVENLYAYAGFNKISYGLYPDDSIVLNPSSYQMLNVGGYWDAEKFSLTQNLFALGAKNSTRKNDYSFGKYMAFHSLKVPLFNDRLSVSYYESSVFSLDSLPVYMLPFPFVALSGLSGSNDNIFLGLGLEFMPSKCLVITADAYLDDTHLKNLIKLKLNESATRWAFKGGFIYSPLDSFCSMISCDYSLATPYMYTYNSDDEYNFYDYTNFGINLGSNLPPNSDRISLKVSFKPIYGLKISTRTSLIRHGNSYEGLSDDEVLDLYKKSSPVSDGSVEMSSKDADSQTSYADFLRQDNIMYVIQAGISSSYDFYIAKTVLMSFGLDYTFEYIQNDGVDSSIFQGTFSTAEEVTNARNAWEDALHDSYNHYFTISFKISY